MSGHKRGRSDGSYIHTPEDSYDLIGARQKIWGNRAPVEVKDIAPPALSKESRQAISFSAIPWLDEVLVQLPKSTIKVLAFAPIHIAAQAVARDTRHCSKPWHPQHEVSARQFRIILIDLTVELRRFNDLEKLAKRESAVR